MTPAIFWSLQWHHNGHDGISNHQSHHCLHNRLFRRRSKKTWKLCVTSLCVGIHQWPVNSQHKWPVTQKMFPFDDVIMCSIIMWLPCPVYITVAFHGLWDGIINSYPLNKMATISQTSYSNAFSWMKICWFWLKFHRSLFPRVQLTISLQWFRKWLGADQATSHYLNQWWLFCWCIYVQSF